MLDKVVVYQVIAILVFDMHICTQQLNVRDLFVSRGRRRASMIPDDDRSVIQTQLRVTMVTGCSHGLLEAQIDFFISLWVAFMVIYVQKSMLIFWKPQQLDKIYFYFYLFSQYLQFWLILKKNQKNSVLKYTRLCNFIIALVNMLRSKIQ